MKRYKLEIEEIAWQSIKQVIKFVSIYNIYYSQKVLKNIFKSIKSLEYFQNRNPCLIFNKNYRKMLFLKKYIIIYFVDNLHNIVYIKYVFSTKQNYNKFIS